MCVTPFVSIHIDHQNNQSVHNTSVWRSEKATNFGCVRRLKSEILPLNFTIECMTIAIQFLL